MRFETPKGEKVIVPTEKILLISEEKKGVTIVMEDGTPIPISEDFATVERRFARGEERANNLPMA